MRLAARHARAAVMELARYPSFSVPTLLFPLVAYLAFGARQDAPAPVLMGYYAAFALLGVAFFQFGVGIAAERSSPWHVFLRILPAPAWTRIAARVAAAIVFGGASAATVIGAAVLAHGVRIGAHEWLLVAATLLLGAVPFALLGVAIGYWASPRGALPVANLVFIGLAYAGGMLTAGRHLHAVVASLSPYLPTRLWGDLLAAAVDNAAWDPRALAGLLAYAALFAVVAAAGFRRDEGERFR